MSTLNQPVHIISYPSATHQIFKPCLDLQITQQLFRNSTSTFIINQILINRSKTDFHNYKILNLQKPKSTLESKNLILKENSFIPKFKLPTISSKSSQKEAFMEPECPPAVRSHGTVSGFKSLNSLTLITDLFRIMITVG